MSFARRIKLWRFRRQAKKIQAMARRFDKIMAGMRLTRTQRRQMWTEIIKNSDVRMQAFESLVGGKP